MSLEKRKEDWLSQAKQKWEGKFNYDKVNYKNANTKVVINCPIHGDFEQTPSGHLNCSHGCPKCGYATIGLKLRMTHEEFIKRANELHDNFYTYLSEYVTNTTPIKILCPEHGECEQTPDHHLKGRPFCCKGTSNRHTKMNKTNPEILKFANEMLENPEKYDNWEEGEETDDTDDTDETDDTDDTDETDEDLDSLIDENMGIDNDTWTHNLTPQKLTKLSIFAKSKDIHFKYGPIPEGKWFRLKSIIYNSKRFIFVGKYFVNPRTAEFKSKTSKTGGTWKAWGSGKCETIGCSVKNEHGETEFKSFVRGALILASIWPDIDILTIDHIDSNHQNNTIYNLESVSKSINTRRGTKSEKGKLSSKKAAVTKSNSVNMLHPTTRQILKTFTSTRKAGKFCNKYGFTTACSGNISRAALNKDKRSPRHGFFWEYTFNRNPSRSGPIDNIELEIRYKKDISPSRIKLLEKYQRNWNIPKACTNFGEFLIRRSKWSIGHKDNSTRSGGTERKKLAGKTTVHFWVMFFFEPDDKIIEGILSGEIDILHMNGDENDPSKYNINTHIDQDESKPYTNYYHTLRTGTHAENMEDIVYFDIRQARKNPENEFYVIEPNNSDVLEKTFYSPIEFRKWIEQYKDEYKFKDKYNYTSDIFAVLRGERNSCMNGFIMYYVKNRNEESNKNKIWLLKKKGKSDEEDEKEKLFDSLTDAAKFAVLPVEQGGLGGVKRHNGNSTVNWLDAIAPISKAAKLRGYNAFGREWTFDKEQRVITDKFTNQFTNNVKLRKDGLPYKTSGYILFCDDYRRNSDVTGFNDGQNITKAAGATWSNLSEDEKNIWLTKATEDYEKIKQDFLNKPIV